MVENLLHLEHFAPCQHVWPSRLKWQLLKERIAVPCSAAQLVSLALTLRIRPTATNVCPARRSQTARPSWCTITRTDPNANTPFSGLAMSTEIPVYVRTYPKNKRQRAKKYCLILKSQISYTLHIELLFLLYLYRMYIDRVM
jgi:hypothetical protein